MMEDTWPFPAILPVPLTRLQVPLLACCTPHQKAVGWEVGHVKDEGRIPWALRSVPQKPGVMCPVGAAKERLHQSRSMTSNKKSSFSPMSGDPRVDGWWMDASCILHLRGQVTLTNFGSGKLQFLVWTWQ